MILYRIRQDKHNFLAVGCQDKTVKIFNEDYTLQSTIDDIDYPVASTATDEDGEFVFTAEKNGKIRVHNVNLDKAEQKSIIEVNANINAISFETKYFIAFSCATSKGLIIHEVNKQNKILYQKLIGPCLSLAWDASKKYLFAGFADGIIRVFKFDLGNN